MTEASSQNKDIDSSIQKNKYSVLILGASYGSLLSTKLLLAGHNANLVCRSATADLFNNEGAYVRTPIKGRDGLVEIHSNSLPGELKASSPDSVDPSEFDLVVLAMQEPQYSAPEVKDLVRKIAESKVPTMAITNMPLLPYLKRIPGLSTDQLKECFMEPSIWEGFDSELMTLCSPDPQAFRPPDESPNILQVRLPTNFKAAKFSSSNYTDMLKVIERDIENARLTIDEEEVQVPVKLRVYDSIFVPLAKWAMLMTGNYRCVLENDVRSISEAVHSDIEISKVIYDWVVDLCIDLGGHIDDFVPFEKYAKAANSLASPSSAARALAGGALNIERVDKLVATIADQRDKKLPVINETVGLVENWLRRNRSS